MSMRYKGGVISATPPTTSTSSAVGMWTLEQQFQAIAGSGWPLQRLYWIGSLGGVQAQSYSIAVDSSNNYYIVGKATDGGDDIQIAKYDATGTIQWQRKLAGGNDVGYGVAVDSSANIYICGVSDKAGTQDFQLAKYNTSGTIQWQRRLTDASISDGARSIAVDSSGNVYVCGYTTDSGTGYNFIQLAKYNTSGAIQWQRSLGSVSGPSVTGYGIAVDSSGNVYVCGDASKTQIAKYNTSGTIQWQRNFTTAGGNNAANDIAVDSSGNIYVCGYVNYPSSTNFLIVKYNTSGTVQWQKFLGNSGVGEIANSIAVSSAGDVYVCGDGADSTVVQLAKYNTSGTIQWQRSLSSSGSNRGYGVALDSLANVYLCGQTNVSGTLAFLFAKVPSDGSKAGSYTVGGYSFTYGSTSLAEGAAALTDQASSYTDAATSLTDAASTLTDAATSLTSSVTTI